MTITHDPASNPPTWTVRCDMPECTVAPIVTITDTKLADILRSMGYWVGSETPPVVYCPAHAALEQAAGQLPPRTGA